MRPSIWAGFVARLLALVILTPVAATAAGTNSSNAPRAAPAAGATLADPSDDATAAARAAVARIESRLRERPEDATLHYNLAVRRHASGDLAGSVAALREVARLGDGFVPVTDKFFAQLAGRADYEALREQMAARVERTADAPVFHRFADRSLLPEGIAWDPVTRQTFVGSLTNGSIVALSAQRTSRVFAQVGEDPVLGLAVHAKRRRLCAVTTNGSLASAESAPRNAVVCYQIDSGWESHRVAVPAAQELNDLAFETSGEALLVSDSARGSVWHVSLDGTLREVTAPGLLPGANGLALSANGRNLYVAHGTGIAWLRWPTAELVPQLSSRSREHVSAIDGLYWHRGALIGIQGVTTPGRVIRIILSRAGDAIERVQTLQSHHHPEFDEPTTAAITDRVVRVLATTQVSRLQPDGTVRDEGSLKRATLVDVPY